MPKNTTFKPPRVKTLNHSWSWNWGITVCRGLAEGLFVSVAFSPDESEFEQYEKQFPHKEKHKREKDSLKNSVIGQPGL